MSSADRYVWKEIPGSSHDVLRRRIQGLGRNLRLLDLGAAGGELGRAVRDRCAYLVGVELDASIPPAAREGYDDWRSADALAAGEWEEPFDVVVCADLLEHIAVPEILLRTIQGWLKPNGVLLVSVPNVANVSIRVSLLLGSFRYTERGILDRTHLSFYTRDSAGRLLEESGFRLNAWEPTAMPYELALPWLSRGPLLSPTRRFAQLSSRVWPTLFGYQFVFEAVKK